MGSLLTYGRAQLQHRVVDADVLALGIEPAKSVFEFCGSKRGCNFFQQRRGIGKMLSESVSQGPRSPEKHPTVPKIMSCFEKLGSAASVGFFREAADPQHFHLERRTGFDIAVPGFRTIGPNTQHHDVFASRRNLDPVRNYIMVAVLIFDYMVRREQANDRLRITAQQKEGSEPDGRRGVASHRLCDDLPFRKARHLLSDGRL